MAIKDRNLPVAGSSNEGRAEVKEAPAAEDRAITQPLALPTAAPVAPSAPLTIKARNKSATLLTLANGEAFPSGAVQEISHEEFDRWSARGLVIAV